MAWRRSFHVNAAAPGLNYLINTIPGFLAYSWQNKNAIHEITQNKTKHIRVFLCDFVDRIFFPNACFTAMRCAVPRKQLDEEGLIGFLLAVNL
jgi:hypothetical protein